MIIKRSVLSVAVAFVAAGMGGCASYSQETLEPEYSVPANLMFDYGSTNRRWINDADDGTQAHYNRGSRLNLLALALMASSNNWTDAFESTAVITAMKPDSPDYNHRHPMLFASIPYRAGGDDESAATEYLEIIEDALRKSVADTVEPLEVENYSTAYYTGFPFTSRALGCSEQSKCILKATLNMWNWEEDNVAGQWVDKQAFEKIAFDRGDDLVKLPEAPYYSAVETVSLSSLSQVRFISQDEDFDYEGAYKKLSEALPGTFYIYLPPEEAYGINTAYPYMLNAGEKKLFETP